MRRILGARILAAAIIASAVSGVAAAQDAAARPAAAQVSLHELVLQDGSRLYGSIEREDENTVVFRTQAGTLITARRSEIKSLRLVSGTIVKGEFLRRDPNPSRLLFGPTGRTLGKGEVYLGVYEFLMPFVQVGLTDRLSIGGGTPLVFAFDGNWQRPFWVTPKLQVYKGGDAAVSIGAFHAFDTDGQGGGVAYGVATFGSDYRSLTVGAGAAYTASGGEGAVVMIGGESRIRRNVKLITENYLWTGGNGIASGGFRFMVERLSADLALAIPIGVDALFVFPVVNFVYVF